MLAAQHEEMDAPDEIPALTGGIAIGPAGGALSTQPWIDGRRLDDIVGPRFALITRTQLADGDPDRKWWSGRAAILDAHSFAELQPILGGADATVIRPDHYVYATGALSDITRLAASMLSGAPSSGRGNTTPIENESE